MRKLTFCLCKNKEADQLRGNREADQPLCFRYSSDGICNSFINPTPYLEMGYFLPFYTENAACIYGLIFSLPTGVSFICIVYS